MEYIVLTLLILIFISQIILLVSKPKTDDITERMGKLETCVVKEIGTFKNDFSKEMNDNFIRFNERVDNRLRFINDQVNERLDHNFEKTNQTFTSILERLSKIDEAQKKIDHLSNDIVSLQSVLTDKKTRGIFGEVNLYHILDNVFGKNDKIYKMQYHLENGTIVDCMLFAPDPLGMIGIDSKFPLEHYRMMVDKSLTKEERELAHKQFKTDMKSHIDAIADKYIIPGVTSDQAILFLPAEAIFAEVSAYHNDIIEYAYKRRIWITSPTTLISTLTTLEVIMKNMEREQYAEVIRKELSLLENEFNRYRDRWDKLSRNIDAVSRDVKDLHTTTNKITRRFDSINQVEMDKKDEKMVE